MLAALDYTGDDQLARIRRIDLDYGSSQPVTDYRYERATGRLSGITHSVDAAPVTPTVEWTQTIDEFFYNYDRDDRITKWATYKDGTATYSYDKIDQLAAADRAGTAQDESYSYDDAGNRLTSTLPGASAGVYQYGTQYQQNRLLDDGIYTYLYNDEGTLQRRTLKTDNTKTTDYTWDHRNRLLKVAEKNGSIIVKQTEFTYDALDRRIRKTFDSDGQGPLVPVAHEYVHDGDNLYLEYLEYSPGVNTLTHRYLHGPAVDQVLLDEDIPNVMTKWLLTDHENSIRDVYELIYGPFNHKNYDSFGRVIGEQDQQEIVDAIFGYTGREFDDETGLQYNRHRYYEPPTGRFISQDPRGVEPSSDYNLYRYAGNNPLNAIDPTGLMTSVLGQSSIVTPYSNYGASPLVESLIRSQNAVQPGTLSTLFPLSHTALLSDYGYGSPLSRYTAPSGLPMGSNGKVDVEALDREFHPRPDPAVMSGFEGKIDYYYQRRDELRDFAYWDNMIRQTRRERDLYAYGASGGTGQLTFLDEPSYAPIAEIVASVVAEPIDWILTARDIYKSPGDWKNYLGLLPLYTNSIRRAANTTAETAETLARHNFHVQVDTGLHANVPGTGVLDTGAFSRMPGTGVVDTATLPIARPTIVENSIAGRAREARVQSKLEGKFPNASVQQQQYLRNSQGQIAKDPLTGQARRVDHVVIENGQARFSVETTSKSADKIQQLDREARIRSTGGNYVRDRYTGNLIDISQSPTRVIRVK